MNTIENPIYILFDIGANWGHDSLLQTKNDHNIVTYAFEPTPELAQYLTDASRDFSSRYNVIPLAVSDYNGSAAFNVAGHHDWGCSSLNIFEDNLDKTWPGREDFYVTNQITVCVTRLDTWIETHLPNISCINYFHCDAQGSDLKVLQGLGRFLPMVEKGTIECASADHARLYKESPTLSEVSKFLTENGFEIVSLHSNDVFNNEFNVHFKKILS
jgi:FkbM family methyltransferase